MRNGAGQNSRTDFESLIKILQELRQSQNSIEELNRQKEEYKQKAEKYK